MKTDARADITKAVADLVSMSFNGSIALWLTEWNFPGPAFPQVWRVMDEPEDTALAAERDEKLLSVGFKAQPGTGDQGIWRGYEAVSPVIDPTGL